MMRRAPLHPIPWLTGLALAAAVACSSSGDGSNPVKGGDDTGGTVADTTPGGGSDTASPGDDTATSTDTAAPGRDVYPDGPYGNKVGSIMPNFAAQGYLHFGATGLTTEADYVAFQLSDVRAKAPQRWAMIHEVGFF